MASGYSLVAGQTVYIEDNLFASFDPVANNTNIYVIDPVQKQVWSTTLAGLSDGLIEQLQSTNMEFIQHDDNLYVIGDMVIVQFLLIILLFRI